MKKLCFMKTLLVAVGLCAGVNAWGDEAILTPTADTELNWSDANTSYGSEVTLNCGTWQEMWTNATPGLKGSDS